MVTGQVILERDLDWFASLGDDDPAQVSLRYTATQVRPRLIASQGRRPEIRVQLIKILVDVDRVVLGNDFALTPGPRSIWNCHRNAIRIEGIDSTDGLHKLS